MASEVFFSRPAEVVRIALLFGILTVAVYFELKTGRIFNTLTMSALLLGLAANTVIGGFGGLAWSSIGALVGFSIYFFFYLVGLMLNCKFLGGGDVKLMAGIGAVCGLKFTFYVVLWASIVAAVMGVFVLVRNGVLLKGLVRSLRLFFLMPPEREDENPIVEGGVSYCLAIALGALITFMQLQGFE